VLDRSDPSNEALLKKVPDAAPNLTLTEAFDLGGFREVGIWKAGVIEFVGELAVFRTYLLVESGTYESGGASVIPS
jgi:hypothetical protein